MNTLTREILQSFDALPEDDQRALAREILRRTVNFDLSSLSDDDLILGAEELFLGLDRREATDGNSQSQ